MDLLYFITEESQPIRMLQRVGENVDDRAPDGILTRRRNKIYPFESLLDKGFTQTVIRNIFANSDGQDNSYYLFLFRHRLFQSIGIGNYIQRTFARIHHFTDGSCSLDAEGGFVITLFYCTATVRKEEYTITFNQVIQVCTAIFGCFTVRENE